jgi:pimeloyl-ACP methyl ester carboxylesterase
VVRRATPKKNPPVRSVRQSPKRIKPTSANGLRRNSLVPGDSLSAEVRFEERSQLLLVHPVLQHFQDHPDFVHAPPSMSMTAAQLTRRVRRSAPRQFRNPRPPSYVGAAAVAIGALATLALVNRHLAKKAALNNPPAGRFLELNGVRLHYIERGSGEPLVLLHGSGSMIQDFETSGLIDLAAKNYRVIVFDRPGFGHSDRPRNVVWTPDAQAELIKDALARLRISNAIILGHSWGTSIAIALALKFPGLVRGLILASGYYYPTIRADVVASTVPSLPLIGDLLSHTVSPLISRATWPMAMAKIFGPKSVPKKFDAFPKEMALRPSQIRAAAAESTMMFADSFKRHHQYADLKMPVVIVAGDKDRLVDINTQSARLHSDVSQSRFHRLQGNGHMIQQTATDQLMSAISEIAGSSANLSAAE